jgi:glutamate--cysteine ligase catalytic subunit
MYDQLAVLAPIMMAMTAATPIFKGRLSDIDCRWTVISQSVDDRTDAEQGLIPNDQLEGKADDRMAGRGIKYIPKSRYDSVSTYIYHCKGDEDCHRTFAQYNDIPCPIDENFKQTLRQAGVDENLAHHLAHLFVRDPLVAFAVGSLHLPNTQQLYTTPLRIVQIKITILDGEQSFDLWKSNLLILRMQHSLCS